MSKEAKIIPVQQGEDRCDRERRLMGELSRLVHDQTEAVLAERQARADFIKVTEAEITWIDNHLDYAKTGDMLFQEARAKYVWATRERRKAQDALNRRFLGSIRGHFTTHEESLEAAAPASSWEAFEQLIQAAKALNIDFVTKEGHRSVTIGGSTVSPKTSWYDANVTGAAGLYAETLIRDFRNALAAATVIRDAAKRAKGSL